MTITEAAAELGITTRALQLRVRKGEMRAERIGPILVVPRTEVDRWKMIGKRKGGRPPKPKEPTAADLRQDETDHQDALEEARQRIRSETKD